MYFAPASRAKAAPTAENTAFEPNPVSLIQSSNAKAQDELMAQAKKNLEQLRPSSADHIAALGSSHPAFHLDGEPHALGGEIHHLADLNASPVDQKGGTYPRHASCGYPQGPMMAATAPEMASRERIASRDARAHRSADSADRARRRQLRRERANLEADLAHWYQDGEADHRLPYDGVATMPHWGADEEAALGLLLSRLQMSSPPHGGSTWPGRSSRAASLSARMPSHIGRQATVRRPLTARAVADGHAAWLQSFHEQIRIAGR